MVLREEKSGQDIKSNMYHVNVGDFVLSGIDARNGAFGIVPKELDGAVVTNDFWCLEPKKSLLRKDFFLFLTSTKFFDYICNQCSDGTTQRIRLQKDKFYDFEIALPPLEEQEDLVKSLVHRKKLNEEISTELTHQLDLGKQLRQALLREAMQGKLLESSPPLKEEYPKGEVVAKKINNLPYLKTFRKKLRNNSTAAEAKLWSALKGKQLEGRKFRRQFSVANYILDFYCPAENLAIELDGQGHFEASQVEYDYERDQFLIHCGIKVLRFENKWVWNNLEGLLEEVKSNFGWKENNPSVLRTAPLEGEQQIEDARQLLEKIKAEKERLIKEKNPSTGLLDLHY